MTEERKGFDVIFSVRPPEQILSMVYYRGRLIVATTLGVYEIDRDADNLEYSITKKVVL